MSSAAMNPTHIEMKNDENDQDLYFVIVTENEKQRRITRRYHQFRTVYKQVLVYQVDVHSNHVIQ